METVVLNFHDETGDKVELELIFVILTFFSLGGQVPSNGRGRRGGHLLDGAQRRDQALRQPQGLHQDRGGEAQGSLVRREESSGSIVTN